MAFSVSPRRIVEEELIFVIFGSIFDRFYMFERYFTPLILLYCAPLDEFLRVIFVHFGALSRGRGTGVNPKVVTSVQAYLMTDFIVHWSYY